MRTWHIAEGALDVWDVCREEEKAAWRPGRRRAEAAGVLLLHHLRLLLLLLLLTSAGHLRQVRVAVAWRVRRCTRQVDSGPPAY